MRVFLNGSSSWAEKPIAGFSALERMTALWKTATEVKPTWPDEDAPACEATSIWVSGLFPLWQALDIDLITRTAPDKKALWLHSEQQPDAGVLRLSPHMPAPEQVTAEQFQVQYAEHFQAYPVSSPTWQPLVDGLDYARQSEALFARNAKAAMEQGACLASPKQTWIEDQVQLAEGVFLGPCVYLARGTSLEAGVSVHLGSWLKDVTVASGTVIKPYSVLEGSTVGENAAIGPFSNIRTGTVLGAETRVGNFVETKKTQMGKGSKASHLTYLGDADIGSDCNIGAGTITCNYDGFNKWKTELGDRVFIGSDSQLVAPVKVESGAFVAAGSTVTSDVPADGLAIARSKQVNKPNRAKAIRERARRIRETAKQKKEDS